MSEDVKPYGAGDERDDNAPARLKELRALTEQLGLSQRGVAREIEVDERTVRYWFSAQYPTPLVVIYALRHLRDAKAAGGQFRRTFVMPPEFVGCELRVDAGGKAAIYRDGFAVAEVVEESAGDLTRLVAKAIPGSR
jgi:hypothetical protein